MKKIISIFLVFVLIFSLSATSFAATKKCNCSMTPVVFVPGFGDAIYLNPESEDRVSVFPPESDAITNAVPDILKAVFGGLLIGNFDNFGTYAINAANTILGDAACYPDGTPHENTGIDPLEMPTFDSHKLPAFDEDDNGYFKCYYDWRLDPIENAKILHEYIDAVKKLTGHKEVVLACHSQGNTVVASYLHLYGSKNIEKLVFLSPAFQGLSLIGALFTRDVSIYGKGDAVAEFIESLMGFENVESQLISAVIKEINDYGIVDFALNYVQRLLDDQLDRVFDECLIDILGTMPGIWAFVPDEYYEEAKESMFRGLDKYDELEKKIDYYHYNIQTKITKIINKAKANGTEIAIVAGYDISSIPVSPGKASHSDFLIDTKYMTIGATCAPIGETLGDNYKQAKKSCGHNHVSPDLTIDASTCAYPEYTWFISGNEHNSFNGPYCEFIEWLIRYNGQPTVRSNKSYPQFMKITEDALLPVEGTRAVDNRSNLEKISDSAEVIIKREIFG